LVHVPQEAEDEANRKRTEEENLRMREERRRKKEEEQLKKDREIRAATQALYKENRAATDRLR